MTKFPAIDEGSAAFAEQLKKWCADKAKSAEREAGAHPDPARDARCEGQAAVWKALAAMLVRPT